MRIDILTLFPDTLGDVLSESILGRAQERGYISIEAHQIRGGAHEYLIPAVPEVFIASADPDAGIIRVHMMKGLATDEN